MPRVLDLIRNSEVPFNLMHAAARGSLGVPPEETIEILVYLAVNHKLFGETARMTLASWDEKASLAAAADPRTSAEVLAYFIDRENLRPVLLPALAENPAVREASLDELAVGGSRSVIETLMESTRVMNSRVLLQALQSNEKLRPKEFAEIAIKLAALGVISGAPPHASEVAEAEENVPEEEASEEVLENTVAQYLRENAAELDAEKEKPFSPIETEHEDAGGGEARGETGPQVDAATDSAGAGATAKPAAVATAKPASAAHARKQISLSHEERRDSALQRIS